MYDTGSDPRFVVADLAVALLAEAVRVLPRVGLDVGPARSAVSRARYSFLPPDRVVAQGILSRAEEVGERALEAWRSLEPSSPREELAAAKLRFSGVILTGLARRLLTRPPTFSDSVECLWGRVDMKVYSTGRDLLQLGVIPCEDMLPEVAYVKLMWVLGKTRELGEVARLMRTNIAGEISKRSKPETFPHFM